jgi:hypothetical protein
MSERARTRRIRCPFRQTRGLGSTSLLALLPFIRAEDCDQCGVSYAEECGRVSTGIGFGYCRRPNVDSRAKGSEGAADAARPPRLTIAAAYPGAPPLATRSVAATQRASASTSARRWRSPTAGSELAAHCPGREDGGVDVDVVLVGVEGDGTRE